MTVAPHLLPPPLDPVEPPAETAWLPGLTSVTRLVGAGAVAPLRAADPTVHTPVHTPVHNPVLALVPDVDEDEDQDEARAPGVVTEPPRVLAAAGRRSGSHGDLRLVETGPEATAAWATLFCQTVVEVMAGDRNPQQLIRRLDAEVYDALLARRHQLRRVAGGRHRHPVRAQVRSVRISQPTAFVAEVAARVEHGQRSRAMAVRLELVDGRWVCTALELG